MIFFKETIFGFTNFYGFSIFLLLFTTLIATISFYLLALSLVCLGTETEPPLPPCCCQPSQLWGFHHHSIDALVDFVNKAPLQNSYDGKTIGMGQYLTRENRLTWNLWSFLVRTKVDLFFRNIKGKRGGKKRSKWIEQKKIPRRCLLPLGKEVFSGALEKAFAYNKAPSGWGQHGSSYRLRVNYKSFLFFN